MTQEEQIVEQTNIFLSEISELMRIFKMIIQSYPAMEQNVQALQNEALVIQKIMHTTFEYPDYDQQKVRANLIDRCKFVFKKLKTLKYACRIITSDKPTTQLQDVFEIVTCRIEALKGNIEDIMTLLGEKLGLSVVSMSPEASQISFDVDVNFGQRSGLHQVSTLIEQETRGFGIELDKTHDMFVHSQVLSSSKNNKKSTVNIDELLDSIFLLQEPLETPVTNIVEKPINKN
ncbi:Hypothetical_protein [Hexamita inflata]|uniref:Hypothetical_protein n=1 Tax=Hexamita inflata TaxID=28002 RepID=A0AA86Q6G3_9EUKA|nr:Hypothetical protein HINF_LOCUS34404 [Hexamita inflata]